MPSSSVPVLQPLDQPPVPLARPPAAGPLSYHNLAWYVLKSLQKQESKDKSSACHPVLMVLLESRMEQASWGSNN
eukprot:519383-Pelagomonas_calceolata.AAC.12